MNKQKYATYAQKKALFMIWNNNQSYINCEWVNTIPPEITGEISKMFGYEQTQDSLYKAKIPFHRAHVIINQYLDIAAKNKRDARIMREIHYHH